MKKQNGITLLALVITIIVLLILAGVSISMVIGNNGILEQTQNAVNSTKSGTAKEQVTLAWGSCETDYLVYGIGQEKMTYLTANKLTTYLSEGEITAVSFGINTEGDSELIYKVRDGEVDTYYKMKVTSLGEVTIIEGPTTIVPTLTPPLGQNPGQTAYLVDIVEVGEYVDIGIEYENKEDFYANDNITTTSALTGWRVLSKSGSGETGTVKLVSAGCPLTYYHSFGDSSVSIPDLEDLYKELSIVTSGTGFRANGFASENLQTVFRTSLYIDTEKGVHALGCSTHYSDTLGTLATLYTPLNEIEEAYTTITGQTKTMMELYNIPDVLGTTSLMAEAGDNWKQSYTDLLANGQIYRLGGASCNAQYLWDVGTRGNVSSNSGVGANFIQPDGIRPVVTLQSGVMIDSSNTGNGSSSSSAYSITK